MVDRPDDDRVVAATAALDKVRRNWMRRPGVNAVDVGFKIADGEITDTVALRAHVDRKRPPAELPESEVFTAPDSPVEVDGFPVDVLEARYGPATLTEPLVLEDVGAETFDRRSRTRPILGGISVGNPRITAGTLGAVVYDRSSCAPMVLSNFHVLAGALSAAAGEAIWQPAAFDGGTSSDRVATLRRFRIDASMDAAVATLDAGIGYDRELLGLGTVNGIGTPSLGMNVVKSGRTTGVTSGLVDGVSMTVSINYGAGIGVVTLTDQVHLVPRPPWPAVDYELSMGGDSGSVWVEESSRNAVGLHFAGETSPAPAAENAICTPVARIATEFNFSFLPVLCRGPRDPFPRVTICQRYPAVCEWLRRVVVRVPWPPIEWPPTPGPGPDPGPLRDPLGGFGGGGAQSAQCGCGGPRGSGATAADEELAQQFVALLAELGGSS